MGKPGALGLLVRSCLCFSGCKRDKESIIIENEVNLVVGTGGNNNTNDGGDVSVSLPDDIIFDVLTRLPVKTLCRFRSVSEGWRALISDPAFAAAVAAPLVVGVFGEGRPYAKFYPHELPRFVPRRRSRFSCGVVDDVKTAKLMCCGGGARLDLVFVDHGDDGGMVIDPATGLVTTLRGGEFATTNYNGTSNGFGYNALCFSSFGSATPSGTYKVVRLRDAHTTEKAVQICQIVSIGAPGDGSGAWRQRPEAPILTCFCSAGCGAFADGVLYFMARGSDVEYGGTRPGGPNPTMIAPFDLESEEWKAVINGPPIGHPNEDEVWRMALAVLKGSLCLVQTVKPRRNPRSRYYTHIWLLEYTIKMPETSVLFRAIETMADGRILVLNAFRKSDYTVADAPCILQLYDPSTGGFADLMEMADDFRGPLTLYAANLLSSSS
ncbi:hypothetical protein BS78_04G146000 [Paspalum vaginatum]|nr:hypothetical protein BS78_04G146000 [Paspalum vaginatum]